MSIRKSNPKGRKKASSKRITHASKRQSSSHTTYVQSSEYVIGQHGSYIELKSKDGSHFHVNTKYPELFVMKDGFDHEEVIYIGDDNQILQPAVWMAFDDHAEMYNYLQSYSDQPKWHEALHYVWTTI